MIVKIAKESKLYVEYVKRYSQIIDGQEIVYNVTHSNVTKFTYALYFHIGSSQTVAIVYIHILVP